MKKNLNEQQEFANDLIDFISYSPSAFHVTRNIKAALLRKGFKELSLTEDWKIEKEGKYFVSQNDTALVTFIVGMGSPETDGFRIIAAHTDSPCIKVKPNPEISSYGYLKLNTEIYGSTILSTWFDRPLSIAGRVALKTKDPFHPEIRQYNAKRPILTIPNLAIHFNRNVNDGKPIDPQTHVQPILCCIKSPLESSNYLVDMIASELNTSPDNILNFDLSLYDTEKGCLVGANSEFILSPKLDNLAMIHAAMESLFTSPIINSTQMVACFDNEEVGSRSRQGAGSPFLKNILERIIYKLNGDKEEYMQAVYNSFLISADAAHAVHPNYPEAACPTNHPIINHGPVIKFNSNQKYTTDAESAAIFTALAQNVGTRVQHFTNRSNLPGGSTLGNILSSQIDIKSVDVGTPLLAMHSARELCGVYDHFNIKNIFKEFFSK
ncbi:MAG: M18 family aminopeptidase [Bacteroidales bacterium]|nr:M18 family aminopeptidase [Bacteroidales bacterium]